MKILNQSLTINLHQIIKKKYLEKIHKAVAALENENRKVIRYYISNIDNSVVTVQVTVLDYN
ncbi:MAG: hypothetical protein ACFFDN_51885 [Candidatus Hodarchaeota archaeon]